jgi:hypothetical protein
MNTDTAIRFVLCLVLVFGGAFIVPNGNAEIIYPQAPEGESWLYLTFWDHGFLSQLICRRPKI